MNFANYTATIFASLSAEEENRELFADTLQKASITVNAMHSEWRARALHDLACIVSSWHCEWHDEAQTGMEAFAAQSERRVQETGGARATAQHILERVLCGPRAREDDGARVFQAPDPRLTPPPETLQPLHHSAQAGGSPLATQIHANLSIEEENRGPFTDAMQKASSTVNAGHSEWRAEADAEMRAFAVQSKRRAEETDSARATAQNILERVLRGLRARDDDGARVFQAPSDKEAPPTDTPQPAKHSTQAGNSEGSPRAAVVKRIFKCAVLSACLVHALRILGIIRPELAGAQNTAIITITVISSALAVSRTRV